VITFRVHIVVNLRGDNVIRNTFNITALQLQRIYTFGSYYYIQLV